MRFILVSRQGLGKRLHTSARARRRSAPRPISPHAGVERASYASPGPPRISVSSGASNIRSAARSALGAPLGTSRRSTPARVQLDGSLVVRVERVAHSRGTTTAGMQGPARIKFARLAVLALLASAGVAARADGTTFDPSQLPAAAARRIEFVKDVQPIFAAHCYRCHG